MDRLEALLRGGAQGATAGWGDEAVSKLLGALPGPDDPEGYSREYAAGSADQDYRNNERAENSAAAEKYPVNYNVGQLLGSAPMSIAAAPLAEGVAGAGAVGAGLGGLSGAGSATEGNRSAGGLLGAGIGGVLGAGGAALGSIKGPPTLEPAYATAGITPAAPRGSNPVQGLLNMSSSVAPRDAIMPPFEAEAASETIPKPGRTLRESDIPRMEDIVDEAGDSQSLRDKALIERSLKREPREINRDQEYYNDLIGRYEKRVANRQPSEPVTVEKQTPNSVEKATVRPPKRGKPASVTQSKETVGPGTKEVEQSSMSLDENPKDIKDLLGRF